MCRAHGWAASRVIGHKEWTTRKIDPTFSMPAMRTRIAKRLTRTASGGGGGNSGTPAVTYEPFPGAGFFAAGRRSAVITGMGRRLVAEGCGRYEVGPGPSWTGRPPLLRRLAAQARLLRHRRGRRPGPRELGQAARPAYATTHASRTLPLRPTFCIWPLPSLAALTSCAALAVTVWSATTSR